MPPTRPRYFDIKRLFSPPVLGLSAATAVLLVVLNFGAGLLAGVANIPGATGLITGFTVPFFLVLLNRTTRVFGSVTLCWTLYSTIAISIHLMGPPNVFKPFFGLAIALAYELPILMLRQRTVGFYIGLFCYTLAILGMAYVAFAFLNLPGSDKAYKYMWYIGAVFFAEGVVSTVFALRVYRNAVAGSQAEEFFQQGGDHED